MASNEKTAITNQTKLSELTVADLKAIVSEVVEEIVQREIFLLEQSLPDPDEGLEFSPQFAEELRKSIADKGELIPLEDVMQQLDVDDQTFASERRTMAINEKTAINDKTKLGDLTVSDLKTIVREVVEQIVQRENFILEQSLPDRDEGLEFKPELAERLKRFKEQQPDGEPIDDIMRELGLGE